MNYNMWICVCLSLVVVYLKTSAVLILLTMKNVSNPNFSLNLTVFLNYVNAASLFPYHQIKVFFFKSMF